MFSLRMELAREMEQRQLSAVASQPPSVPTPLSLPAPPAAVPRPGPSPLPAALPATNRAELIKRQLLESDEAPESKV